MKNLCLFLVGLLLSVCSLSSCLKSSRVVDVYGFGVLELKNGRAVLRTSGGDLHSPNLNTFIGLGDMQLDNCYLFLYKIDYDLPENSDKAVTTNGYYTVTLLDFDDIPMYYVMSGGTDLTATLPDEKEVLKGCTLYDYVDGYLFVGHSVLRPTDMELSWELSYDYDQLPTVDGDNRYYDFYVRASVTKGSEKSSTEIGHINAYYMSGVMKSIANKEKDFLGSKYVEASSKITVRFNYVSSIKESTEEITWASELAEFYIAHLLLNY